MALGPGYDSAMRPFKVLPILVVTVVLALPGVSQAKERPLATSTGKSFARKAESAGIRRFAEIRPGLARGGEPGQAGLEYLHKHGYKTIVSFLTDPSESVFVVRSGMKYVHIPMRSGPFSAQPPTDQQVKQFLSVVKDTTQYPMFIHCHAGKDRTGAMTAIYRVAVDGWTNAEAVEEMKAFGFAGRYHRLFEFVRGYIGLPAPVGDPATVAETKQAPAPAPTSK